MSVEALTGSFLSSKNGQNTIFAIQSLENTINKLIAFQPKPVIFLRSNNNNLSSNVADGVLILNGLRVPAKSKGIVEDFNINFTTAAGTVRLVILDQSDNIVTDVLRDINSSTNGTGKTILEEGQRLGVVGQTAGAGVFSVYCSGFIQRVQE